MKISTWLNKKDSHGIYGGGVIADFAAKCKRTAPWRTHINTETVAALKARGLGGTFESSPDNVTCYGWEMAEACAEKFALNFDHGAYFGRGTRFRCAVAALKAAKL